MLAGYTTLSLTLSFFVNQWGLMGNFVLVSVYLEFFTFVLSELAWYYWYTVVLSD